MTLADLKLLLHIPVEDTSQDAYLEKMLRIGIKWLLRVCRNDFRDENDVVVIPEELQPIVAAYIEGKMYSDEGVTSESIGGLSQSFGKEGKKERQLLKEIAELGYRRIKFTPFNRGC